MGQFSIALIEAGPFDWGNMIFSHAAGPCWCRNKDVLCVKLASSANVKKLSRILMSGSCSLSGNPLPQWYLSGGLRSSACYMILKAMF